MRDYLAIQTDDFILVAFENLILIERKKIAVVDKKKCDKRKQQYEKETQQVPKKRIV